MASTNWRTRAAEPLLPLDVLTGAAPAAEGRPRLLAGAVDACGSPAPRVRNVRRIRVCDGIAGLLVDLRWLHSGLVAWSEGGAHALEVGGGRGGERGRHAVLRGGREDDSDRSARVDDGQQKAVPALRGRLLYPVDVRTVLPAVRRRTGRGSGRRACLQRRDVETDRRLSPAHALLQRRAA